MLLPTFPVSMSASHPSPRLEKKGQPPVDPSTFDKGKPATYPLLPQITNIPTLLRGGVGSLPVPTCTVKQGTFLLQKNPITT